MLEAVIGVFGIVVGLFGAVLALLALATVWANNPRKVLR